MKNETRPLPAQEFRLGALKLSIWQNDSNGRRFFKSTLAHVYRVPKDQRETGDNGWRETTSFAQEDLVLIQELVRLAGEWIRAQEMDSAAAESTHS